MHIENSELISKLREVAFAELEKNAYDSLHDKEHSMYVYNDALRIVEGEDLQKEPAFNFEILAISAYWHDVNRHNGDFAYLKRTLHTLNADSIFVDKVVDAICNHSYDKTPISLEGKVLWDADKCQYPLIERIRKFLQVARSGELSRDEVAYYQEQWLKRMPFVYEKLNFSISKEIFSKRLESVKTSLDSLPELAEWRFWE